MLAYSPEKFASLGEHSFARAKVLLKTLHRRLRSEVLRRDELRAREAFSMLSTKPRTKSAVSLTNAFVNGVSSFPSLLNPFRWTQSWRSLRAVSLQ